MASSTRSRAWAARFRSKYVPTNDTTRHDTIRHARSARTRRTMYCLLRDHTDCDRRFPNIALNCFLASVNMRSKIGVLLKLIHHPQLTTTMGEHKNQNQTWLCKRRRIRGLWIHRGFCFLLHRPTRRLRVRGNVCSPKICVS